MKTTVILAALTAALLTLPASGAFDYRKCNDADAVEAALKKERSARLKLVGSVLLAELREPAKVRDFSGMCEVVDAAAREFKINQRTTEDAKIALGFANRAMMADGYRYAAKTKHPYELRFMASPALKKVVAELYTPQQRYERVIELLKKHAGRIDEWNHAAVGQEQAKYLAECAKAVPPERFAADAGVVLMVVRPYAEHHPEAWEPLVKVLENACGIEGAPRPKPAAGPKPAAAKPAATKRTSSPAKTLADAVKAAEQADPDKLATFAGLCAVVDAVGAEYGLDKRYTDDAKVAQSIRRNPLVVDGYRYAVEIGHPYELYFMTRPQLKAELRKRYTPEARYAKVVELLGRHAARYDAWKSAKIMKQFADYLTRCAKDAPAGRFAAAAPALLETLRPYAKKHPQIWEPLVKVLENAK